MFWLDKKCRVISNLDKNDQVALRLRPRESGLPGWFGYPIMAAGYDFCCDKSPFWKLLMCLWRRQRCVLLCFNPSVVYFALFLLPLPFRRVSLFQWKPLGRVGRVKGLVIWLTLFRSHQIVVYSHVSARYLRRLFPRKHIRQIGLFVDENFFSPLLSGGSEASPFILVPGDHKRDERFLGGISESLGLKLIRVTRNSCVKSAVEGLAHEGVEVRYNVSFEELRTLYQVSSVVLILSDSSEIPTGITTLAEALSCGADVVISRGQSSSWPPEIAKDLPFTVIPSNATASEVKKAVYDHWSAKAKTDRQSQARQFAVDYLSTEVLAREWVEILK